MKLGFHVSYIIRALMILTKLCDMFEIIRLYPRRDTYKALELITIRHIDARL